VLVTEKDEQPTLPLRATEDEDRHWGERAEEDDREDVRRLLDEKPPHHSD
jgi:hypothetical protein